MGRGRETHLYIRADDEPLYAWAKAEAKRRRMSLSQFLAMLIEQAQAAAGPDQNQP